ncbi:5-oxoprolinase subunit B family protein [Yoonia sediminilitoris]|uniref:Inhibitor of KinA n=1 Tax=Yoonia sediminilitoris TaxID=1286148 RepID=A0A2T6KG05_9RHOB|nr:allophanate hydrolase subunit 1 [Yoonia sediminilitoris]PUB14257.1 inhibitor of KinA [Yoonia sediminilitoris]RCW95188.1 inhibitor of KinA [Yoonia sediminilitoris]
MGFPDFKPVSDNGLLVAFGDSMTPQVHDAVLRLDRVLAQHPPHGLVEVVPAFVNLMVVFDPLVTDHAAMQAAVQALLGTEVAGSTEGTLREVQVCFDADLAPDLATVADQTGLSEEAVIDAHLAGELHVVMYGFAPGYAYMTGVPEALHLPRKQAPVRDVPKGSVLIAGAQCLVSTVTMPTGWWIIGRSPTEILRDDPARPFLFDVGDPVRFTRIDRDSYEKAVRANG